MADTETLWAFCEECKTLFVGVAGSRVAHPCGPSQGRMVKGVMLTKPPPVRLAETRYAARVVDEGARG